MLSHILRIGFFSLFCGSLYAAEDIYLKAPDLSKENIVGTNVGIRPFRKTGVRLEKEMLGDKLVIHNYGYGGSGLTLAFGGSKEVLDLLENHKPSSKTVAVLGAGVVGLATAYDLLEQGYEVHVYADEWSPHLTSNVAAGIWSPPKLSVDMSEDKKQLLNRMLEIAEKRFQHSLGEAPEFLGVKSISAYRIKNQDVAEDAVSVHFDNGVVKHAQKSTQLALDGKIFMQDLHDKVRKKGAILHPQHFSKVEDVQNLKEPIVINCTSFGSVELFGDEDFSPVRGQVVYFKPQEGFDYLLSQNVDNIPNDSSIYFVFVYPWEDRIIVGGVFELGNDKPEIEHQVINRLIENAQKCLSGDL